MPDDEAAAPVAEPRERRPRPRRRTSRPSPRRRAASPPRSPTRPHPTITTFIDELRLLRRRHPSGNATTSTSHGACLSTWSTVGEKNRDCRRQRGEEPSTIRSAPRRAASSTIAWPIERARTVSACTSTPCSSPSARASASDASARAATSAGSAPSSANSRGTRTTVIASTVRAAAPSRARSRWRPSPRRCRRASSARGSRRNDAPTGSAAARVDVLEHPAPLAPARRREDDKPDGEPGRAGVARARRA